MLEKNFFQNKKRNLRELRLAIPAALSLFISGCKEERSKLSSQKIKDLIESSYRRVEKIDRNKLLETEKIFNEFKNKSEDVEVNMSDFRVLAHDSLMKIHYLYGQPNDRDSGEFGSANGSANVYEYFFNQDDLIIRWSEEVPDLGFSTELLAQGELSVDKETGAILYFISSGAGNGVDRDAEYILKERGPYYDHLVGGRGQSEVYYKEGMAEEFTNQRLEVFSDIEKYLENQGSDN